MIAKSWYWLGLIACLSLLAVAYFYFQKYLGMPPCPLCMFQRGALILVATMCVLGILFSPQKIGSKLLAFGATLGSALGLALAARHVWLQNLPEDLVPECGPPLEYMLDAFPIAQVISSVLSGSGECAEVDKFLGLSIALWMVIVFAVMLIICLRLLFKKERNYFSGSLGR